MGDGSLTQAPVRVTSQTSDLTGDDYAAATATATAVDSLKNQNNRNQEQVARESMSEEWTDQKHSLYLKSMEASFVDDLYNSFDWRSQTKHLADDTRRKHVSANTSSCQFKVLRSGCWEKTSFERNKSRLDKDKVDGPNVLLANPWIRHFRSLRGHQIVAFSALKQKLALAADPSSDDSVEVTDQNFIDEEEVTGEKTRNMCNAKRIKTSITPTQSNDQVVPLGSEFAGSADIMGKSRA